MEKNICILCYMYCMYAHAYRNFLYILYIYCMYAYTHTRTLFMFVYIQINVVALSCCTVLCDDDVTNSGIFAGAVFKIYS